MSQYTVGGNHIARCEIVQEDPKGVVGTFALPRVASPNFRSLGVTQPIR